jgi:hypothetical protein
VPCWKFTKPTSSLLSNTTNKGRKSWRNLKAHCSFQFPAVIGYEIFFLQARFLVGKRFGIYPNWKFGVGCSTLPL